jgi:hypothetical protein
MTSIAGRAVSATLSTPSPQLSIQSGASGPSQKKPSSPTLTRCRGSIDLRCRDISSAHPVIVAVVQPALGG